MLATGGPRPPNRVLVVVPAFREASSVRAVVDEVNREGGGLDLLVVDDGSDDSTAIEARAAGAMVLQLPFNVGVGGAMRLGFLFALRSGYDGVVQVDADGQHDPRSIRDLVIALNTADVAVGSRFAGEDRGASHSSRRWVMRLLSRSVSALCRVRLTDVTSGFRATGPRALPVMAAHYPAEYLGDTVESLVIAHRAGLQIAEVPVAMRARRGGQPSQSWLRASLYVGRAMLVLVLSAVRSHPEVRPSDGDC